MNIVGRHKLAIAIALLLPAANAAQTKPRARELGLPIGGTPGPLDAITDVAGVEVGHTTIIAGSGAAAWSAKVRCAPA